MSISPAESRYTLESCLADFRTDGRSRFQHRPYRISHSSSLVLSNGSSRVHLPGSTTDVLCSVKADLVRPPPDRPDEGTIEIAVDLSLWGGSVRGGSGGGRRRIRDEESELCSLLRRLVLPDAVDLPGLAIVTGRYAWRLSVDLVVLRCDGAVLDVCSMALRAALRGTRLPKVEPVPGRPGNGDEGDDGAEGGRDGNDLQVDGDVARAKPPGGAESCPLIVTISVMEEGSAGTDGKEDGQRHQRRPRAASVVDARAEEEACASSRVAVSVDPDGAVCGVHKLGGGGCAPGGGGGSMPLAVLGDVVDKAVGAANNLYKLLEGDQGQGTATSKAGSDDGDACLLRSHFTIR